MLKYLLPYEVKPGENLPGGLPPQSLVVLSPVWRGLALVVEYPDGDTETLSGLTLSGEPCEVRGLLDPGEPPGPGRLPGHRRGSGLLAVLSDGLRETSRGRAFLALAASLIPPEVLAVIGPPPPEEDTPLLLG